MSLYNFEALTFLDACDHVLDQCLGGDASLRNRRQAVRAVQEAYHEIPARRNWRYYYRPLSIATVASQTTGTVTGDYTGGTYERMLTLSGATWPTNAIEYAVIIDSKRYTIDAYKSSTVVTLSEQDCPTADIGSRTSYTLVKDTYPLPANLRKVLSLYDTNAPGRLISCVDPGYIIRERRMVRGAALPTMYAVYRSELYSGGLAISFAPSPSSARTYQCYGLFWPQPLTTLDYSGTGTVSTTADSTSLTGSGTAFTSAHVGAVIRVSPTGIVKIPTDLQGEIDKNRLEPYALQRIIRSRESATALTLETAADATLAASGYRISSRIDIEAGSMRNAFLRCCEARFATQDRKGAEEREARYERALSKAMYADQRLDETIGPAWIPHTLADVAASVSLTTGGTQP